MFIVVYSLNTLETCLWKNPRSLRLDLKNCHLLNKYSIPPLLLPHCQPQFRGPHHLLLKSLFISLPAFTLFFLRTEIVSYLFLCNYKWLYWDRIHKPNNLPFEVYKAIFLNYIHIAVQPQSNFRSFISLKKNPVLLAVTFLPHPPTWSPKQLIIYFLSL